MGYGQCFIKFGVINYQFELFAMLTQTTSSKTYSKGDYKRLSDRIRKNPNNIESSDYEMLQALRLTYKDSLATVFNTLDRLAHGIDKDCVCTYRIKRIESIISKLLRFPDMEVQRVADIAGTLSGRLFYDMPA